MDFKKYSELFHYGVKGMHWGIRRYQNADGSLTSEGKDRYMYMNRSRRAAKTKSDMDRLYNTLSDDDKKLLGDDNASKEWLKLEEGEYVVKRFIEKYGNKPIAALDIMTTTKEGHLTVAIMTDPKYRGKGSASKLAKKSVKWFNNNAKKYNAKSLGWGAYANNTASRKIAEKSGFVYNSKKSNEDWAVYDYLLKENKKRKRRTL